MKAAAFALLVFACANAQAQEVRLEYADPFGDGTALLGPEQIAIDLVLDIPPTAPPVAGGAVNIAYDPGLVGLNRIDSVLPPCPAAGLCVSPGTDNGAGLIELQGFESPGFTGVATLATLHFDSLQTGTALFGVSENPTSPFVEPGGLPYPLAIDFPGTEVEIIDAETCFSPSLPENFENPVGVPVNWVTFFGGPTHGPGGPQWGSSAEPGRCDFGNVTNGAGNAACVENNMPTRGGIAPGAFLCTDTPLDLENAVLPVLELDVNFQPAGPAIFSVVGGPTPPPGVAGYAVFFETDMPLGSFAELPGETITVLLPSVSPLFLCIVVDGFYAYAEVDECISCALSCDAPDDDGDGIPDNIDNCLGKPNPAQRDTDNDNIGNACDADISMPGANDCVVNFPDLAVVKAAFFSVAGQANYNPDADFNGDNTVNFADLVLTKEQFFGPPGPSGLLNACDAAERARRAPDCAIPSR